MSDIGEQPQIAQARAAVDKARLDLSRTEVKAPMDGVIENADKLQVGQMAVTGVGMISLVHSTTAWVEANFKETDVGQMVLGQRAAIEIDAYSARSSTRMCRASARAPAANSRCCRRRTPTATGSR